MPRGKRDGILIAGGGTAGCLAALAMARLRPDVPILIVEERDTFGGSRERLLFDVELATDEAELVAPLAARRWPGFYVAFPGFSRKLKGDLMAFGAAALHRAMIETLQPDQYRLGTKVVAVREDALVLDGGETIKAEGAIDARGAANLSMLELLYETRLERDCRMAAPHKVDRPVLVDATGEPVDGLGFTQCIPLAPDRLTVGDVVVAEHSQPDAQAEGRLERYLSKRGWAGAEVEAERMVARPLPYGGDFAAFWRIGGARVAKAGLRGGFLHPVTGRTVADAARTALLLTRQRDFAGPALHDLFEAQARTLWKKREALRGLNGAIASAPVGARGALLARLYALDPGLLARLQADALGLLDRRRVQQALAGR
ncbi:lycopene beta-cyclase CrtY [Sphingosinicella sp. LHD-64]|uniref:lycopene beta-cyclase CrtY n=1 Tax=Sphingosinicella sp. LHD-64 TaxID=3072139 RepID=UPI00280F2BFA|nr:lycopene beta-cyclase CrtY [Sphingosinicella sp. LHD-64]MDQ8756715.1 lycopene beta-cyclase CrtY [Sphingosinicella sp. LHD-64]